MTILDSLINTYQLKSITLKVLSTLLFVFSSFHLLIAQNQKPIVYLILGQGADYRLFKNIEIDSSFEVQFIHYSTPEKESNMNSFAHLLAEQIDANRTFYLVRVSLGGMLAAEMGGFINPEKIILISSAKKREKLPDEYIHNCRIFFKYSTLEVSKKVFFSRPYWLCRKNSTGFGVKRKSCMNVALAKRVFFL